MITAIKILRKGLSLREMQLKAGNNEQWKQKVESTQENEVESVWVLTTTLYVNSRRMFSVRRN